MSLEEDAELDLIRLLDSDGKTVLDSVSAGYEDSFSLETFADVIRLHFEATNQEKDGDAATPTVKKAIIARVQTWDRHHPDKAYYSYYDAFHLNKILFQRQIYCGTELIHRLHALNPLTNTDIVGAVQYFQVKTIPKSAQLKAASKVTNSGDVIQKSARLSEATSPTARDLTIERQTSFYLQKTLPPSLLASPSPSSSNEPPTAIEMQQFFSAPGTVINTVAVEDSLLRSAVLDGKGSFKANAKETKRKESPPEMTESMTRLVSPDEDDVSANRIGSSTQQSATVVDTNIQQVINQRRRMSEMRRPYPARGQVTQFARPVPSDRVVELAPATPPQRRRILSLSNAMPVGDQHNSVSEHNNVEQRRLQVQAQKQDTELNLVRNDPSLPEDKNNKKPAPYVYDAILIGTEFDYLESKEMRALFQEHAVTPANVELFEMPEYPPPVALLLPLPTMVPAGFTTFGRAVIPLEQAGWVTKLCGSPTNAALDRMQPCTKIFHFCKCYLFAGVIAYFIFFGIFNSGHSSSGIGNASLVFSNVTISAERLSYVSNQDLGLATGIGVASNREMFNIGMNSQGIGYLQALAGPNGGKFCAPNQVSKVICDQSSAVLAFQFSMSANGSSFSMQSTLNSDNFYSYCVVDNNIVICNSGATTRTTFFINFNVMTSITDVTISPGQYSYLSNQELGLVTGIGVASYEMFNFGMNNQNIGYLQALAGPNGGQFCAPNQDSKVICDQSSAVLAFQFSLSANGNSFTMRSAQGTYRYCVIRSYSAGSNFVYCDAGDDETITTYYINFHVTTSLANVTISPAGYSYLSNQYFVLASNFTVASSEELFTIGMNDQGVGYLQALGGPNGGQFCAPSQYAMQVICDQSSAVLAFQFNVSNDGNSFTMQSTLNSDTGSSYCVLGNSEGNSFVICNSASTSITMYYINFQITNLLTNVTVSPGAYSYLSNQELGLVGDAGVSSFGRMFNIGMNSQGFGYLQSLSGPNDGAFCASDQDSTQVTCDQSSSLRQFQFNVSADGNSFTMKSALNSNSYCVIRYAYGSNFLFCDSVTSSTFYINFSLTNSSTNVTIIPAGYSYLSNQYLGLVTDVTVAPIREIFNIGMNSQGIGFLQALAGPYGAKFCAPSQYSMQVICDQSSAVLAFQFNVSADGNSYTMKSILNSDSDSSYCVIRNSNGNNVMFCDSDITTRTVFFMNSSNNMTNVAGSVWYKCQSGYVTGVVGIENGYFTCSDNQPPVQVALESAALYSSYEMIGSHSCDSVPFSTGIFVAYNSLVPTQLDAHFFTSINFTCSDPTASALKLVNNVVPSSVTGPCSQDPSQLYQVLSGYSVDEMGVAQALCISVQSAISSTVTDLTPQVDTIYNCPQGSGFVSIVDFNAKDATCVWSINGPTSYLDGIVVGMTANSATLLFASCNNGYAVSGLISTFNPIGSISCYHINLEPGYVLSDPIIYTYQGRLDCEGGFLKSLSITSGSDTTTISCVYIALGTPKGFNPFIPAPLQCYDALNGTLGIASPDNSIRIYTREVCTSQLNGVSFAPDDTNQGECTKRDIEDSWSLDCSALNNYYFPPTIGPFNIKHSSGSCIHPDGGSPNPDENTPAVYFNLCDNEDRILYYFNDGNIFQKSSGKCLQSTPGSTVVDGSLVVFGSDCLTDESKFTWLSSGSMKHVTSGKCIHPDSGSPNPADNTNLVFWGLCGESRLAFSAYYPPY